MKACNRCKETKDESAFRRGSQCRACDKIVKRAWEAANPDKVKAQKHRSYLYNRDEILAKTAEYQRVNRTKLAPKKLAAARRRVAEDPEKYRAKERARRTGENREAYLEYRKASYHRRKERDNAYQRERWKNDINWKLKCRLRWFLRQGLKGRQKCTRAEELLGCDIESFKLHLESLFQPGMSFENYGKWHIDHIMPCAIFDLTNREHQKRCFHFSNLRPLWAEDNLRKSASVPPVHQFSLL